MGTKAKGRSYSNKLNSMGTKDIFLYVLYLLLVLLPQYFRGGYFESAFIPYILGMSILMIIYMSRNYKEKREAIICRETDLLLLLLTILYGLTYFYAINKRGSIIEFIKYASFLSLFLVTTNIHKDNISKRRLIDLIILGGIVLCIIGIGTMVGTWEYTASYNGSRLSSTFQYPNTLAVYAASMYFLTMGQALIEEDLKKICLYGGGLFIFFSTMIFTYSRGMWLLFPLILLGFFIVLAANKKVQLFFYTLGSLMIALPASFIFLKHISQAGNKLWGIYFAGIIGSAIVMLFLGKATEILNKVSIKAIIAIVVALGLVATGLLIFAIGATEPIKFENNTAESKLSRITRTIRNVFPNTQYEILVEGTARINQEGQYAGRLVVHSVNEQFKYTNIGTLPIEEDGDFNLSLPITTLEDTNVIVIYFENRNPNTSISFQKASIVDLQTDKVEEISLKYKYIPEAIVRRISGINATDNSVQARLIFSKDAFNLALDSLLLGTGGHGWATAYRSIQSYPYWSKHVHNHYLQLLVETGLLGVALFGGFLILLLYYYYKFKKEEEDISSTTLADTLFIAAATILAHAAIDFDLSLVGLYIILWVFLALLNSMVSPARDEISLSKIRLNKRSLIKFNSVVTFITIIAIVISVSIYGGIFFTKQALKAQEEGDGDGIESALRKATKLDPYNISYSTDLIDVYFFQYTAKSDESYGNKAKEETDRLLRIGKNDPLTYITAAQAYFKFGLVDEGLGFIKRSLEMQPLVIESYIQNAQAHLSIFDYHISKGDLEAARNVALEGYEFIYNYLMESNGRALRPMKKDDNLLYDLSKLKYLGQNFDEYISYLERVYRLEYYYDFSLDVDNDDEVELVRVWNAENGELDYMPMDDGEKNLRLTNAGENYGVFDSASFNLRPSTTYLVSFDARGNMEDGKVSFYIRDSEAKEQNQSESINIDLKDGWNSYELEFTTDDDIGDTTSRFRFLIRGENEGYMDIRHIKIFEKLN